MKNNFLKDKYNRRIFLYTLVKKYKEDEISYLAAEIAYYLIVATIPFLIVAIHLVLFFAHDKLTELLNYMDVLPSEIFSVIKPVILTILENKNISILSVSIIVALWTASNGLNALIRSFNKIFDDTKASGYFKSRFKGFIMTILLIAIIFILLGFTVFGNPIISSLEKILRLKLNTYILNIVGLIKNLATPLAMAIIFSLFYKFGPDYKKNKSISFKIAFLGGVITTIGWLVITYGYAFYISNISNMSITYGPLVGIMVLFIWFYLSSLIMLLGAQIVSVYSLMDKKLNKKKINS